MRLLIPRKAPETADYKGKHEILEEEGPGYI